MTLIQIILLALIQGFAELLPVSSSAHVILAAKLMGLDPTAPEMTVLLVLLHTGTMFAVIAYFWRDWKKNYFESPGRTGNFLQQVAFATGVTLVLGYALKVLIEKVWMADTPNAEVETLFGNLKLISVSLACAGVLILIASGREKAVGEGKGLDFRVSLVIGLVQGLCLPFRGFSRSGATISTGMLLNVAKVRAEEFSFALAVAVTPFALGVEIHRLLKAHILHGLTPGQMASLFTPGLLGMVFSFLAGLLALRWLSNWLSHGRWGLFGIYCLVVSVEVWLFRQ